jgi:hypothetical protein
MSGPEMAIEFIAELDDTFPKKAAGGCQWRVTLKRLGLLLVARLKLILFLRTQLDETKGSASLPSASAANTVRYLGLKSTMDANRKRSG